MPIAHNAETGETLYLTPDGQWENARVAENPETGDQMAFDGSEWKPIERQATLQQQYDQAGPWEQSAHDISGGLRSFGNTLSFGLTDYVAGGAEKLEDWVMDRPSDKSLDDYRIAEKRKREGWEDQRPYVGFGTSMAGAVMNPVNKALGNWAIGGKGSGLLGQMGRGSVAGTASGGLHAAGTSEGSLDDRASQVETGMGVGAGVGLLSPAAVKLVTHLGAKGIDGASQLYKRLTGGNTQTNKAARKIFEALDRDELTLKQAVERIKSLGPEASLIDVGPNTRALGFTVNAIPGKGKKAMTDFLVNRQEGVRDAGQRLQGGQINRVMKQVDKLIPENSYDVKLAAEAERKFLGRMYESAKGGDDLVDTSAILKQLDDEIYTSKGSIQSGLRKIRKLLVDPKGHPEIDIQSLHQAKMAIDDYMQGPARSSIGNVAKRRIKDYQNQLVEAIEGSGDAGKLYQQARLGTAGQWRIEEAIDEGSTFLRGTTYRNPRDLADYLGRLKPEEQEAFKIGAAKALKDILINLNVRQDAAKKVLDIPGLEKKLEMAFGDAKTFQRYIKMVSNEKEMFKAYGNLYGSQTAERTAALADSGVDPSRLTQGIHEMTHGNKIRGLGNVLLGVKDKFVNPDPQSQELARLLTSRSPKMLAQKYKLHNIGDKFNRSLMRSSVKGAPAVYETLDIRNELDKYKKKR